MSSEKIGKLLAGRLFIRVTGFPKSELTFSPNFDCDDSNSDNFPLELCKLETALLAGETEKDFENLGFVKVNVLY